MTYLEIKKIIRSYYPALLLEDLISHKTRERLLDILAPILFILLLPLAAHISGLAVLPFIPTFAGAFCLLAAVAVIIFMLDAFHSSFYFKTLDAIILEQGIGVSGKEPISFEAAQVLYHAPESDIAFGFIISPPGRKILARLGIAEKTIKEFLKNRKIKLSAGMFNFQSFDSEYGITLADLAEVLLKQDKEFADFLFAQSIQEKDLLGAVLWLVREARATRRRERWWSRDALGRTPGIGKDLAYGGAYTLEKYAKDLIGAPAGGEFSKTYLHKEIEAVETILSRAKEANALIVGELGGGALDIIYRLAKAINLGTALPTIDGKRMMLLDQNHLVAATADKATFETEIIKMLSEAAKAGNILLVIGDLPGFIESAATLGSDLPSLMDAYLASPDLQVIAIASPAGFHKIIEPNSALSRRFEKVLIKTGDRENIIGLLEDEAVQAERKHDLFFTYPAIEAIADGAARYFPDEAAPDKATDLLAEIVPEIRAKNLKIIGKNEVLALIQTKTGIPAGEATPAERVKLLNLEAILQKRVVGQSEALKAVATTVRRARSGIQNPNRPLGSFLFLGPTGVGKTETAKALAAAFFGDEKKILRLDMSEYKSADAMDKLIGSFERGRPGVLSSLVRENPYGVLLLDEFEKAAREVLDLFLQVLDEGFFSDMSGKRVNLRNLLIIATSNAGADAIWQFVKQGGDLQNHKEEIVDQLVGQAILKPELLNRFDGVVLFRPIVGDDLRAVAKLQLEKLAERLREKSVALVINEALVDYLVRFGTDPKFGARPLTRVIQDKVEALIAEKLLRGEIQPGQKVELTDTDLQ
ncbi:MAG: AAA family ATPase [Patescibacteria group bacterium]